MAAAARPADASLDGLRDLHLPEPIGWWPVAPGWWWVAAGLSLALLAVWRRVRRARHPDSHRRLVATLHDAHTTWQDTRDTADYLDRCTMALRIAAIERAGRASVAGLTGEPWVAWLEAQGSAHFSCKVRRMLADGVYRRAPPPIVDELHDELLHWARQLSHDA